MANNLTLSGATFDTIGQKFGSSALSGGYGIAPTGVLTGTPWAIGLWFKLNSVPTSVQVMAGAAQLFWLGFNANGTLHGEYGGRSGSGAAVSVNSSAVPSTNSWHFATLSLSPSTMTITLDGSIVGTVSTTSTVGRYDTAGDGNGHATGYFAIRSHGGYEGTGTFQFNAGEIDDVSVWNVDKFNSSFSVPTNVYTGAEASLIALWHLDNSGADSTVAVATGYSLSGPTTGMAGQTSPVFTVKINGATANTTVITPSDSGAGGTFIPPTLSLAAGANTAGTFTYTPSSSGTKAISASNDGSLSNPPSLSYAVASSAASFSPNDPGIVYSPANWLVSGSAAKTINAGAYFRTLFSGSQCTLSFDISANSTPFPQLYYRIDGVAWIQTTLAASVSLLLPSSSVSWPHHYLEVVVKSTSEFLNYGSNQGGSRWSPQNAAVVLTGVSLSSGQSISAPGSLGQSIWFYGDSITEGYHTVGNLGSGAQDTDGSDALVGWAYQQRALLGVEVAIIGFGGASINSAGVLGVPNLPNSYNLMWAGQARSFTAAPDLIVIAYGENDGTSTGDTTFIANYQAVLMGLISATPSTTKIACVVPFSQRKSADIATAIQQVGSSRVIRVDTTGMFSGTDSVDGQHPLGVANLAKIGPAVASKLRSVLQGVRNRWVRA